MSSENHYLEAELQQLFQSDPEIYRFFESEALDGLWVWDLQNPEHQWLSESFWQLLGYDPKERKHLNADWRKLVEEDDLGISLYDLKKHCENADFPFDQIIRYKHKSGSTVWVRCRAMAIRNSEGVGVRIFAAQTDITSLKTMEIRYKNNMKAMDRLYGETRVALEESEQLFETIPDAILQVDDVGSIIKVNHEAIHLFGYDRDELLDLNVDQLVPPGSRQFHHAHRHGYNENPKVREMGQKAKQLTALTKSGVEIPVAIKLSPIQTKYGTNYLAVVRDMTERTTLLNNLAVSEKEKQNLYALSITDSLTGVHNRGYFFEMASKEISRALRYKHTAVLMLIDIDDFKVVNDTHGHHVGDKVLVDVCNTIAKILRSSDIFARIGGEEFAILLPETSIEQGLYLSERILLSFSEKSAEQLIEGKVSCPTVSIGLCELDGEDVGVSDLMKRADKLLYQAKNTGKNRCCHVQDLQ